VAQSLSKPILIGFFLLQLVLYVAVWRTAQPKETDFPAFYSAARVWATGQNPYDLDEQCRVQVPIRGTPCLPFAHPPILLPLINLVSNENYQSSYYRWNLVLLLITAICILPLHRISREWKNSVQSLLFLPVIIAITLGQDTPFILLAVLSWVWLLGEKKDLLSGVVLSLAVLKPQIALLLALPLLFSRPKAFAGFCIGATLLTAYSLLLVGPQGFRGLLGIVEVMSQGTGFGVNPRAMINAAALLVRAGLSATWSWAVFAVGVVIISVLWKRLGTSVNALAAGINVALFCAPHLHLHDLSLLSLSLTVVHPSAPLLCSLLMLLAYSLSWQQWAGYAFIGALFTMHLIRSRQTLK